MDCGVLFKEYGENNNDSKEELPIIKRLRYEGLY